MAHPFILVAMAIVGLVVCTFKGREGEGGTSVDVNHFSSQLDSGTYCILAHTCPLTHDVMYFLWMLKFIIYGHIYTIM